MLGLKSDAAVLGQRLGLCTNLNGSDRTLMSRVRFLNFSQKKGSKYTRPRTFDGREHSGRLCRYNKPVQYGRDAAHIS